MALEAKEVKDFCDCALYVGGYLVVGLREHRQPRFELPHPACRRILADDDHLKIQNLPEHIIVEFVHLNARSFGSFSERCSATYRCPAL